MYSSFAGLFLNIKSPSQCHGNVTQWRFCFGRFFTGPHEVQFMVFRPNRRTQTYDRVEGSHMVFQESNPPEKECRSINANQAFEIQPNDIVAACMKNQVNTNPLRVTSYSMHEALQITSIGNGCVDDDLNSLNLVSLNSKTRNLLLVEAVISKLHTIVEHKYYCVYDLLLLLFVLFGQILLQNTELDIILPHPLPYEHLVF